MKTYNGASTNSILFGLSAPSAGVGLSVLLILLLAWPVSAASKQVLRGHVPAGVTGLASLERLTASKHLSLAIVLPLRDPIALKQLLEGAYDATSPKYHQYLTPDQFTERFGPTEQDYEALITFARANHLTVTATHPNRTVLDVEGAVVDIEKAFHVNLCVYQHPKEARTFYAPNVEPSFELATAVLHISGLDNYIVPRPMSLKAKPLRNLSGASPADGSGPSGTYMGFDFRAAYVPGASLTGAGQSVGLVEFDGYYGSDIAAYKAQAGLPNVPVKTVLLDGFNGTPDGGNVEVALDIEMAISMAPGLASVIVYEGFITDSILNRMATDNLAKQLSASWLYSIDDGTEQVFQQFAAQGQSFFNASGDGDAWADYIYTPADDPYITIVGGTTLTTSGPGGSWVAETVWNWGEGIGTGGGISTTYAIPSWQQGVSMVANHGSTTMRNLPDVALTADNIFVIADDGAPENVGGTSAATPLWAGFIALVNQQAAASGKPPVGFINPAIYAIGQSAGYTSAFHDITTGDNTSPDSPTNFYAVAGYDLCTGWGTPQGLGLINVLAPPDPLQIIPMTGFTGSGGVGGPFTVTSQNYFLTNAGTGPLNWTLTNPSTWLNASPTSGTLTPGGPASMVTVSLNAGASNLLVGTYSLTLWFTNLSDGLGQSRLFTLSVIKPPVITMQPSSQTVLGGATATFSVTAAGGLPLGYQWQSNGTNLADGGNISGSATSRLTITNVSLINTGAYTVVVSNPAGIVTSAPPALLTIIPSLPVIVSQPASQIVLFGGPVRFSVTALGNAPLLYQWRVNGTNLMDGDNISGSASTTLSIGAASSGSAGTYSVVVSNALGSTPSTGAVLTVYARNDEELLQNGGFETGDFSHWNGFGNFTLSSTSGDGLYAHSGNFGALLGPAGSPGFLSQAVPTDPGGTYLLSLWLDSPDGLTPNMFRVTWDGNPLFDQSNLGAIGWTNLQFIVTATGANTTLELGFQDDATFLGLDDLSLRALLSPDGPPVITAQPPSQTVALAGATATIKVVAAGRLPLAYEWRFEGALLPGATDATLTLPYVATNQSGVYSVVVTNSFGSAAGSNAALTVLKGSGTLITFDDLAGSAEAIPAGYNDLNWQNFYCLDAVNYYPHGGYRAGMVSSNNVAFNGGGTAAYLSSGTSFSLISAYVTAAWNDNLRLEIKGYSGATLIYHQSYSLSATTPTLIAFNCLGVTSIEFLSSGGTPHPGYDGAGTHFVLDNVTVVTTPGPPLDVLYSFGGPDGGYPYGGLVQGTDGNFYGTTEYGGDYNSGTVFRMTPQGLATLVSFDGSNGSYPMGGLVQAADGNFYGTTTSGGSHGSGTVFRVSTNGTLTTLASFDSSSNGGYYAQSGVVQGADGNFYGTTEYGGTFAYGTVFRVTTNGALRTLASFGSSNGSYPQAPLIQGSDGNFYGTTPEGGLYGDGTVFRITTSGVLTTLVSFNYNINGAYPYGGLVRGVDSGLYGTTSYGSTNGYGGGTIFRMTTNGILSTLVVFNYSGGYFPDAGLVQGTDGSFYGTTAYGGRYGDGTIFKMTSDGTLATLRSFTGTNGAAPQAALVQGTDGDLYGTTPYGGAGYNGSASSGDGAVFRLTFAPVIALTAITVQPVSRTVPVGGSVTFSVSAISSDPLNYSWRRNGAPIAGATQSSYTTNNVQLADSGSRFSCLVSNDLGSVMSSMAALAILQTNTSGPLFAFSGFDGGCPIGALVPAADGNFYGTTEYGGIYGYGTVFSMTTNGILTTLVSFNGSNGRHPLGGLVQGTDGNFYGTTSEGGANGDGTVFKMTANGMLTTLASFNYSANGYYPAAGLVQGADGSFYGTTEYGGADYDGTVFRITTNGVLTTLVSFNYTDGSSPCAGLVQAADGSFYGTTSDGGANGDGTVFRMTINGTLTSLASFNYSVNGSYPTASLVQGADGNLYGTTEYGGANYDGTVFRMTTSGLLTTLVSFDYSNGADPHAGLVQGADGRFYGTTAYGGRYGNGTVFRLSSGGTTLTNLVSFDGTNGASPQAALIQAGDGNFYGAAAYGGAGYSGSASSGNGTVFRVAVAQALGPPQITGQPTDLTVPVGGTATFCVSASGSAPLRYFWNRDGAPIAGATQYCYSLANVQMSDSGSQFSCLVSNAYGTATGQVARLTVVVAPTDWFTELFNSAVSNSLAFKTFTFTPDGSANFYAVCSGPAVAFPTDPTGGTLLTEGDDTYAPITLSGGNTVAIYNNRANEIYVGSNGYLTMNAGDTSLTPTYTTHFSLPRVSALYRDLNPGNGGRVSWKQLADHIAVTYQGVPIYGSSTQTNSFQVELFFDGRIRLTYLSLSAPSGLVGLSAGAGQPANFVPSDFTAYSTCTSQPSVDHFVWDGVASLQHVNSPFTISITAMDTFNLTVTNFAGPVSLSGSAGGGSQTNCILGNVAANWSGNNGSFTLGYAFTPTNDIQVTHVRSYGGNRVSVWTDGGVLLATQNVVSTSGTWIETPLATPITLEAGTRYRVGIYTAGATYYYGDGGVSTFSNGTIDQSYNVSGDSFPDSTDSDRWWLVDLRYTVGSSISIPITPTISGSFVNGVWSGSLTVLQAANNVVLTASDGAGHIGSTAAFQVVSNGASGTPTFVPGSLRYNAGGYFQFTLAGAVGAEYEILVSTNLQTWTLLTTIGMTNGASMVLDTNTSLSRRFYRAVLVP